jgi:hypothetical protein
MTVPHNPQQNGVAERKNRSIEETVKALLNDQGLSMFLWGEATMTIIYVNVYAIIIVLCISIDNSNIRTRSLRNTHSQETTFILGNPLGEENPTKTSLS